MTGKTRIQRRQEEDVQIQKLAHKHASLVNFKHKHGASLRTQQFSFSKLGPPPIRLKDPEPMKRGRKKEGFADRRMTPAERQRKHRTGQHLLMPTAKRPAQANIEAVEKRESQSLSREHEVFECTLKREWRHRSLMLQRKKGLQKMLLLLPKLLPLLLAG